MLNQNVDPRLNAALKTTPLKSHLAAFSESYRPTNLSSSGMKFIHMIIPALWQRTKTNRARA